MFDTVLNKCTTFCKAQPQSSVKTQTFSNIILTSASLRCFFVWYGFASSASKLGSPAPTQCQSTSVYSQCTPVSTNVRLLDG